MQASPTASGSRRPQCSTSTHSHCRTSAGTRHRSRTPIPNQSDWSAAFPPGHWNPLLAPPQIERYICSMLSAGINCPKMAQRGFKACPAHMCRCVIVRNAPDDQHTADYGVLYPHLLKSDFARIRLMGVGLHSLYPRCVLPSEDASCYDAGHSPQP